ncbi:FLYWCH zinc finger domain-containing protein [Phthorimaea operculella]|nr:FLYWCH zinc finger domain-containing protein [Phthorimaea operculella]
MSKRRKPIIQIGSYRFSKHYQSKGNKDQWLCTSWSGGCRASLFTMDGEIIFAKNTHKPIFLTSRTGSQVLVIGRYRFYKNHRSRGLAATWFCSRSDCRASVRIVDETIIGFKNEHCH